jgi:hypothetical protein
MRGCTTCGSGSGVSLISDDGTILISGVGSAQTPFDLRVGDIEINDKLSVIAGTGVDLTRTGQGTTLSPIVLTIGVHIGIDTVVTPTTGQTQTLTPDTRTLVMTPAGTLAAQTITLPGSSTTSGKEIVVVSSQIITALTVNSAGGVTVAGAPTTLAANGFFRMRLVGTVWRRVG